jgi:hypothetical protein
MAFGGRVFAHEVRPAYLEITEESPGEFDVLWKTPTRGELRLGLDVDLSPPVEKITPVSIRQARDAAVETWRFRARESLRGRMLRIRGLEATISDVLVRIQFADGGVWLERLTPSSPSTQIPAAQSVGEAAARYLKLGVEHILLGMDHLLFVLALLLVSRGAACIVKAVTAFTVAHSITLGLATMGLVHVPSAPTEALIALSIALVAAEAVRECGGGGCDVSRRPWPLPFAFRLLHGLGFAGAHAEIGQPERSIPLALVAFNVGVEMGQLAFIGLVLAIAAPIRRGWVRFPKGAERLPPYAIGSVAMLWVLQRFPLG